MIKHVLLEGVFRTELSESLYNSLDMHTLTFSFSCLARF